MTSGTGPQGWPEQQPPSWQGQGAPYPGSGPQAGYQPPALQGWTGQQPPPPTWQQQKPPGYTGQQPTWQQPPAQQGWTGQQPPPPTWQQQGPPGYAPGPAPGPASGRKRSRTPVLVTAIAVVVALLAGGAVYFFAFKNTKDTASGQSTPQAAVTALLGSLSQKDVVGIAAQLDPAEAHLSADMSGDVLHELQRLGIIKPSATADKLSGVTVTTKDLTFTEKPVQINDHIAIVELTGGTVTVASAATSLPFSEKMTAAFPALAESVEAKTQTITIADKVAELGHPIRIATVKRGDSWYPSLFYTIADNAAFAQKGGGYTLDPIPAVGSATPEDAMNALLQQATSGSVAGVISTLSPDEMGVLHDYGNLLTSDAGDAANELGNVKVSNATWDVTDVTGGKKVSVKTLTVTVDGKVYSFQRTPATAGAGWALSMNIPEQGVMNVNADNLETWIKQSVGTNLDPRLISVIKGVFPQVIGLGVVMTQTAGKWYVSPLRTFSDVFVSLLKGLNPPDIDYFISLAKGN